MFLSHHADSLRRHATRLASAFSHLGELSLPLNVMADELVQPRAFTEYMQFRGQSAELFLDHFPHSSLLLGAPGAGKSHGLRTHAARAAAILLQEFDWDVPGTKIYVPLLIDLKRYQGSISRLLGQMCPGIDIEWLIETEQAGFLVDSFNEAPKHYLVSGELVLDLQEWMKKGSNCRWIITSRTNEGLDFFPGEQFRLWDMDEDFVRREVRERRFDLGQRHGDDLIRLLQKPIFFSALLHQRLRLKPGGTHPAEAIESMIESYSEGIKLELRIDPDLLTAFGPLAVEAVEAGEELLPRSRFVQAMRDNLATTGGEHIAESVVERLLKAELLLAFDEERIAFYHQSITELIASRYMARQLSEDMQQLDRLLLSTRWDESLFLVTHYLDKERTSEFFQRLLTKDPLLAVRAVRYFEDDRPAIVTLMLKAIWDLEGEPCLTEIKFSMAMQKLPVDSIHVPLLRELHGQARDYIAGTAAFLLVKAIGIAAVEPIIERVFETPSDWGLGHESGKAICDFVNPEQAREILQRLRICRILDGKKIGETGVVEFTSEAFKKLDSVTVIACFQQHRPFPPLLAEAYCRWADDDHLQGSLEVLVDLMTTDCSWAVVAVYFRIRFHGAIYDLIDILAKGRRSTFYSGLEQSLRDSERVETAAELLHLLASQDPETANWRTELIERSSGILRLALVAQDLPDRLTEFWKSAEATFAERKDRFEPWENHILVVLQSVDWTGHEALCLDVLSRRDVGLMLAIIGGIVPIKAHLSLSWDWVRDLLPWFEEETRRERAFIQFRFPRFVHLFKDAKFTEQMMAEFNRPNSPFRDVLAQYFVTPDDRKLISEEAIISLVARLHEIELNLYDDHAFVQIATDEFVEKRLLPLLQDESQPFHRNLTIILRKIGEKLRKRYW